MSRNFECQSPTDRTESPCPFQSNDVVSSKVLAATALNHGLDTIIGLARFIPNGAEIKPDDLIKTAKDTLAHLPFKTAALDSLQKSLEDTDAVKFLEGCTSIRKDGNKFTFQRKEETDFPLNLTLKGAAVTDLHMGKTFSFDLSRDSVGNSELSNINGIRLDATVHGIGPEHRQVPLKDIQISKDENGHPVFHARLQNPKTRVEKILTGDSGKDVLVGVRISDSGDVTAVTEKDTTKTAKFTAEPQYIDFS